MKAELKEKLKDKLARKILMFFYQNQGSIDSASGVAAWVHSDREEVKGVLDFLVGLGVLHKDATGVTKGYCYTRDEKVMKVVDDLLKE